MIDDVKARSIGVEDIRLPSEVIFSSILEVNSVWDSPMLVSAGGLFMDVDRLLSVDKALNGDQEKTKEFLLASGMKSSVLEHSVPELFFSSPENPVEGISAVKALQIANDQGIPIYTVNQSNISVILPQLQLDSDVEADIQNAVNAGHEVTVSKTDITYNNWTGVGYIIIDPNTGNGAYMISEGLGGAFILAIFLAIIAVVFFVVAIFAALSLAAISMLAAIVATVLFIVVGFVLVLTEFIVLINDEQKLLSFVECVGALIGEHALFEVLIGFLKGAIALVLELLTDVVHATLFMDCLKQLKDEL